MRLIQLIGDGLEELWNFPDDVTDEEIIKLYREWNSFTAEEGLKDNNEYTTFEEYLDEYAPQMQAERIYVDEIYI